MQKFIARESNKEIVESIDNSTRDTERRTRPMRLKNKKNKALYFILILAVIVLICAIGFWAGSPERLTEMNTLGGLRNMAKNSAEIERIGRFAVQQHNNNQNTFLEFARVLEAKEQVVAGKMYHLTLEAVDGGEKKMYGAKIWEKPWMNFKQLQEFKQPR
ncbi:cysteine proteinase inhibitor isoform X3 [Sesamum indicum]|uniref:Cysteine proteinase inhibitor n=1 Tax=Sesamum indicum TaxID=4182 RepID=A0A6I9SL01_SESIN|nr:cysteine proteinase inhibitor isoform X3 [Sesamum indicum]